MTALIGIDLGGTKTEVAVLGGHGQFLFRQRLPTPSDNYQAILNTIHALVEQAFGCYGCSSSRGHGLRHPGVS